MEVIKMSLFEYAKHCVIKALEDYTDDKLLKEEFKAEDLDAPSMDIAKHEDYKSVYYNAWIDSFDWLKSSLNEIGLSIIVYDSEDECDLFKRYVQGAIKVVLHRLDKTLKGDYLWAYGVSECIAMLESMKDPACPEGEHYGIEVLERKLLVCGFKFDIYYTQTFNGSTLYHLKGGSAVYVDPIMNIYFDERYEISQRYTLYHNSNSKATLLCDDYNDDVPYFKFSLSQYKSLRDGYIITDYMDNSYIFDPYNPDNGFKCPVGAVEIIAQTKDTLVVYKADDGRLYTQMSFIDDERHPLPIKWSDKPVRLHKCTPEYMLFDVQKDVEWERHLVRAHDSAVYNIAEAPPGLLISDDGDILSVKDATHIDGKLEVYDSRISVVKDDMGFLHIHERQLCSPHEDFVTFNMY